MTAAAPKTLAEALALLQGQLPRVGKEHTAKVESQRTGKTHTYDYADLTDVSAALLPVMAPLGLSFSAKPTLDGEGRFVLRYLLRHVSSESDGGDYRLPDPDRVGPQDLGKAISYARRYALCAITGLAPGGDDDDAQGAQESARKAPPRNSQTNAQLRDAGRMDRTQEREHKQLEADTKRQPRRAERARPRGPDPDSDPWAADAPVDGERAQQLRESIPDHEPEDKPGSILPGQHRAIERLLGMLGIPADARGDRHQAVALTLGLDPLSVASMNDLSCNQAGEVIRELDRQASAEREASRA
jgi:ERF superfamily